MAMIYATDTHLDQLHHMVSGFCFVAKRLDEEIDQLLVQVITKQKEQYFDVQVKDLCHKINDLKNNQEFLKRVFTGTIMKFCQLIDEQDYGDYSTYLEVLQDQVLKSVANRAIKTEEEIKLVIQAIEWWNEKEAELNNERQELALKFAKAFPCDKGFSKKDSFHDVEAIPYHTKDQEINVDIVPLKNNGTWNWINLDRVEEPDDQVEWSLTKVMMKMYGFNLDKAKTEEEAIRHLKAALFFALKNHRNLTKRNLTNEIVRIKKYKLAALLQVIGALKNSSKFDKEVQKANKLMLEWLYQIEREIFFLVNDMVLLVSTFCNQVVAAKFREDFRLKLQVLKRQKRGRVPVVVYRLLALLEGEVMEAAMMEGRGLILLKEIQIGHFMNQLYKLILLLTSVLNANSSVYSSGTSNKEALLESVLNANSSVYSSDISNKEALLESVLNANSSVYSSGTSNKEALLESVEIVRRCDEEWKAIRMEVDESMREA